MILSDKVTYCLLAIQGFLISLIYSRLSKIPHHPEILLVDIISTLPSFQQIEIKERDLEIINGVNLAVAVSIDIKDIEDLLLRLQEARREAITEDLGVEAGVKKSIEDPPLVPAGAALPHHQADPRPPLALSTQKLSIKNQKYQPIIMPTKSLDKREKGKASGTDDLIN
jgi:hypothetical protein